MADLVTRLREALLGRYTVERELGRGGMATVFLAHDLRHDRPVALKVLHPELAAGMGSERFEREIRLAARLQHPHILPVHDSGEAPGEPALHWFTMPYVEGESLRERLRREPQLPLPEALRVARQIADALEYAHRQGVVHRDVKPENILLSGEHALVADFGVARALAGGPTDQLGHLTGTGMAVGTVSYMSPEQSTGEHEIDARTDQYSLACVLYEMLVGEPPFTGPTAQAIVTRRFTEEPRPLRATRPGVPDAVERAVATALARVPADRFDSVTDFARALDSGASSESGSTPVRPTPRKQPLSLALTLALGFLLGVGVLFAWRWSRTGAAEASGAGLIAVLPFENLGDSADAYFADGMTDEVRGKLASLPGFQVIARASASQYRAPTKPLGVVAEELGVRYLLTGTIRWVKTGGEDRVRVRPELVEIARNGATVTRWQDTFDAGLTDVFQVQADIAGRVAAALHVALTPAEAPSLTEAPTTNLAAYDEFLRGERAYYGSSGTLALREAAGHYARAVALDSSFARAWGRLSQVQSSLFFNALSTQEIADGARQAAERALAQAPRSPEAHLAMGHYLTLVEGDYAGAIDAYSRGLESAPAHPELLGAIGLAEQGLGRLDDAIRHMREGLALDPRSLLFTRRLTRALTWTRRYPEAEELSRRARALAPADPAAIQYQAYTLVAKGDSAAARAVLREFPEQADEPGILAFIASDGVLTWLLDPAQQELVLRLPPSLFGDHRGTWGISLAMIHWLRGDRVRARAYADSSLGEWERQVRNNQEDAFSRTYLGLAYAVLGRRAEAIREAEHAVSSRRGDYFVGPYLLHLLLRTSVIAGDHQKALDTIETLLGMPSYLSPGWLRIDPYLDPLRPYPRFQALLAPT